MGEWRKITVYKRLLDGRWHHNHIEFGWHAYRRPFNTKTNGTWSAKDTWLSPDLIVTDKG